MARPAFKAAGAPVEVFEPVVLLGAEKMSVGSYVRFSEFAYLAAGMGITIGSFVHVATHVGITGGGLCLLEDFVGVCAGAKIITGTDDVFGGGIPTPTIPAHLHERFRSVTRSFVHCGRHSFVGTNAVVLPGVTVGEGAVIASGSVVTRDVPPWTVVAGTPARPVKDRPRAAVLAKEAELFAELGVGPTDFTQAKAEVTALMAR